MEEKQLYDPIGEWLIKNKGCQQDEFSQGYLKNRRIIEGFQPDVFAIRYEPTDRPAIRFHGFIVEVKENENGLNEMIGKVIRNMKKMLDPDISSGGVHTLEFYIAYPIDKVSNEIFELCEEHGIGILRLDVIDKSNINVYEVLEPKKEIQLNGISNSAMQNPGSFENAINFIDAPLNRKRSYLGEFFQRPSKLYDKFIRPIKEGERLQRCRFCRKKLRVKELKILETREGNYYCCPECFEKERRKS